MDTSVNACILSYNHPEVTARAVEAALRFFDSPVLVHNGSLPKHIKQLQAQFPMVDHQILTENQGYSGGVNFGLNLCFKKWDWVLFLSNDCELRSPPKLPLSPQIVSPKIYRRKLEHIDSVIGGFLPEKGKLQHFRSLEEYEVGRQNGWQPYLPGSAFLLHRSIFETVGGMDTSLGTYWDDVDWSMRAQEKGFSIQPDSDFEILHRVGKTCHKNPLYSIYYFQRNKKRISWKYCPPLKKPKLAVTLARDWLLLSTQLIRRRRTQDIRLLTKALWD